MLHSSKNVNWWKSSTWQVRRWSLSFFAVWCAQYRSGLVEAAFITASRASFASHWISFYRLILVLEIYISSELLAMILSLLLSFIYHHCHHLSSLLSVITNTASKVILLFLLPGYTSYRYWTYVNIGNLLCNHMFTSCLHVWSCLHMFPHICQHA